MNIIRVSAFFLLLLSITGLSYAQERFDPAIYHPGGEYTMAWTGGMNAPQFTNIDFNRDGIQDLVSFDRQGDVLRTYVRLPASGRWIHTWEYESIFPPLYDWVHIADYNGDGVEDIFTSSIRSGVAGVTVYRGAYENDSWSFELVPDRGQNFLQILVSGGLTNLYVSWDDIPSIKDVDGDTDLDILAFEPGGSFIHFYKNISIEQGWGRDSLRFELADICWGKILENEFTEEVYLSETPAECSDGNFSGEDPIEPRHSGSTIMTLDYDFDGDLDAYLGDISSKRITALINGGTPLQGWMVAQDVNFPQNDIPVLIPYFIAAYSVELDDDPEPELMAAVNSRSLAEDRESVWRYDDNIFTDGPLEYQLTEKGAFQNQMFDLGSHSRPVFADINGDELVDLVVGGYHFTEASETRIPYLWYFRNTGTPDQPVFTYVTDDYLGMSQFATNPTFDFAPAFGDIDNNGSVDLVVGDQNGKLFFYKNVAAPGDSMIFEAPVYPYMNITVGVSATPQIVDINGDGLSDLVIGERTGNADGAGRCGAFNYLQNVGSVGAAFFNSDITASPNTPCFGRALFDIPPGLPQYSTPSIVRTEDGLVLFTGNDPGKISSYGDLQNGLTGSFTLLDAEYGNLDVGIRSAPALADITNDGYFELVIGNQRGGLEMFTTDIKVGTTSVAEPGSPAEKPYLFIHHVNEGIVNILWKDEEGTLSLLDMTGRKIATSPDQENTFDLQQYPPGMYLLRVELNGKFWIEKFVKAR